ncbi:LytR/AlgR family response regulator transcription factor [Enterococcus cecorum]|uniref:LytR/AlgR family response regulator transcription factor n=1 Tax=Enterococcus cecorum TaxID=44008 RepID=UPI0022D76E57|nr:response regulator transcription factor [Enterococcus cecorum]CAI3454809.1 response regulator transcription factor [Enterococcus cecorum]
MNVAICDDNMAIHEQLHNLLSEFSHQYGQEIKVFDFMNAQEVLDYIQDEKAVKMDLLLLDIEMDGLDGIALNQYLIRNNKIAWIVYISNFVERMSEAFSEKTLGFISKPIDKEKLFIKVLEVSKKITHSNLKITIKDIHDTVHTLYLENIEYFEALRGYTKIHLFPQAEMIIHQSFTETIAQFQQLPIFVCHRSYASVLSKVKKMTWKDVTLLSNAKIPLGRKKYQELQRKYMDYMENG